eukprot:TRINITY_DN5137_c0_g3_i2.p2 TRINITY_DN5137_c0_g3~~TRINITY_DN5137_c0_g3_i2.p2  ORF type:complete len:265 (+),score=101.49 TRINITY_DN5137_c0_g3_i2:67-795(+)
MRITISIIEGKDLLGKDSNRTKSDPYVTFSFKTPDSHKHEKKTKIIKGTLNPKWSEEFVFVLDVPNLKIEYLSPLKIQVRDHDVLSDDFMGEIIINFAEYLKQIKLGQRPEWIPLKGREGEKYQKHPDKVAGSLKLNIDFNVHSNSFPPHGAIIELVFAGNTAAMFDSETPITIKQLKEKVLQETKAQVDVVIGRNGKEIPKEEEDKVSFYGQTTWRVYQEKAMFSQKISLNFLKDNEFQQK